MSERLKPCPFCGGEAKLNDGGISTYVACTVCDNRTFEYYHSVGDSASSAISAWNYRTPDIIRCGECNLWNDRDSVWNIEHGNFVCSCAHWSNEDGYTCYTAPDDFCSYGQRRESGSTK